MQYKSLSSIIMVMEPDNTTTTTTTNAKDLEETQQTLSSDDESSSDIDDPKYEPTTTTALPPPPTTVNKCNNNNNKNAFLPCTEINPQTMMVGTIENNTTVVVDSSAIENNTTMVESMSPSMVSPANSTHTRSVDYMRRLSFVESFSRLQPITVFSYRTEKSIDRFSPSPYRSPSPPSCCDCCDTVFGVKKGPVIHC